MIPGNRIRNKHNTGSLPKFLTFNSADAAPLYKLTCEELGWSTDGEQLGKMEAENKKALEEMDAKMKDAEENFGAVEVKQAYAAKAEYFCEIGQCLGCAAMRGLLWT